MKRRDFNAAIQRLNYLVDTFPNYRERDSVFYDLGDSLALMGRKAEARLYFERVISEFPNSEWAGKARKRLNEIKTA